MLALVTALLSFVAGPSAGAPVAVGWPAEGSAAETLSIGDLHIARAQPCCETSADPSPDPCAPDEPCAPGGGCCACVSCASRVADAPPASPERRIEQARMDRARPPESTGIDGEGAVWHPPRG